jgi:hypothetical protein
MRQAQPASAPVRHEPCPRRLAISSLVASQHLALPRRPASASRARPVSSLASATCLARPSPRSASDHAVPDSGRRFLLPHVLPPDFGSRLPHADVSSRNLLQIRPTSQAGSTRCRAMPTILASVCPSPADNSRQGPSLARAPGLAMHFPDLPCHCHSLDSAVTWTNPTSPV